jgi:hypothetical protein
MTGPLKRDGPSSWRVAPDTADGPNAEIPEKPSDTERRDEERLSLVLSTASTGGRLV